MGYLAGNHVNVNDACLQNADERCAEKIDKLSLEYLAFMVCLKFMAPIKMASD